MGKKKIRILIFSILAVVIIASVVVVLLKIKNKESQLSEQKIFNDQFESYISNSSIPIYEVGKLRTLIDKSNLKNEKHKIEFIYPDLVGGEEYYKVEAKKDSEGFYNKIIVTKASNTGNGREDNNVKTFNAQFESYITSDFEVKDQTAVDELTEVVSNSNNENKEHQVVLQYSSSNSSNRSKLYTIEGKKDDEGYYKEIIVNAMP